MIYLVQKLNKKYADYHIWKYRVALGVGYPAFRHDSFENYQFFNQLRVWMTEQYGPSCERNIYKKTALAYQRFALAHKEFESFEPPWCWHIDSLHKDEFYIYVKDDAVLSNFTLKWN